LPETGKQKRDLLSRGVILSHIQVLPPEGIAAVSGSVASSTDVELLDERLSIPKSLLIG